MFWGSKNSKNSPSPVSNRGERESVEAEEKKGDEFNAATIIAEGTYINGRIEVKNHKIFIDGRVDGAIEAEHLVIIGNKGIVGHRLKGEHISVSGKFTGNIVCDWIEIEAGGEVNGEVLSNQLVVKPRGVFEGKSRLKTPIPKPTFRKIGEPLPQPKESEEIVAPQVAVGKVEEG